MCSLHRPCSPSGGLKHMRDIEQAPVLSFVKAGALSMVCGVFFFVIVGRSFLSVDIEKGQSICSAVLMVVLNFHGVIR